MKTIFLLPTLIPLLTSCVSQPITLAPVGPNPVAAGGFSVGTGHLQVFSSLAEQNDDQNQGPSGANPIWYQHTDYNLYDANGKRIKHVDNTTGHYATPPRIVSLRPGNYTVRAEANDGLWVRVPVVIEQGRTTKVHLDDAWKPPAGTPNTELVSAPDGSPIGWRAGLLSQR